MGTAVDVWWVARTDEHPRSDAIVVLGASQFDGRPSAVYAARLDLHERREPGEHDRINHGIYRDFPTRYRGRNGSQLRIGFIKTEFEPQAPGRGGRGAAPGGGLRERGGLVDLFQPALGGSLLGQIERLPADIDRLLQGETHNRRKPEIRRSARLGRMPHEPRELPRPIERRVDLVLGRQR